jgi:hypothetical protein
MGEKVTPGAGDQRHAGVVGNGSLFSSISRLQLPGRGGTLIPSVSGRSVAWLARLFRVQEVVSSNLTAPTILFSKPKPDFTMHSD